MTRLVKTRVEVEGTWHEQEVVLEGHDLAPWAAGAELLHVGRPAPRLDGIARITGRALYTHDVQLPGMLHAAILRSPHAHARVLRIDPAAAARMPGVVHVLTRDNVPEMSWYGGRSRLLDDHLRYEGDEVAAVAAHELEQARQAAAAIEVDYEILPAVFDPERALAGDAPRLFPAGNRASEAEEYRRGDPEAGFREAAATVELEVRTPGALHNSMETHGSVAWWQDGRLTLWESTQNLHGIRKQLADRLGLPLASVRVIGEYMGGGFGSKNSLRKFTLLAALLSRATGRPVRCVLDREEENRCAGNRAPAVVRVRLGAERDGRLTAIHVTSHAAVGAYGAGSMPIAGPAKTLYACANVLAVEHAVNTNVGPQAAFRAPGYVEGTVALESAMDELARKLGLDPRALRERNHADVDPASGLAYSGKGLSACLHRAVDLLGTRHMPVEGHKRRGTGVACQVWGAGGGPPAHALVKLNRDASATVITGTQDIGTGTRTALALVAAEEVGLDPAQVEVLLGDTATGLHAPLSAGSMTLATMAPAVRVAAAEARAQLVALLAARLGAEASELRLAHGRVWRRGESGPGRTLREVLGDLDDFTLIGRGERHPNPEDRVIKSFGAHATEVEVDVDTGEVRVLHHVAVHDIGRVVNPLAATSQVQGAILQGMGLALFEERIIDPATGRVLNPNLEDYRVATSWDVPRMTIAFLDQADAQANNVGARGLGEPPIIPVPAALANAVRDAIGVRVTTLPMTPARVLAALGRAPALAAETELDVTRPDRARPRGRKRARR